MKQPTIFFAGKEYPVVAISWRESGELAHVCFIDDQGEAETAFQSRTGREVVTADGLVYTDLEKALSHNKVGDQQ